MINGERFKDDQDLIVCDKDNDESLIWCAENNKLGFTLTNKRVEESSGNIEYFIKKDKLLFRVCRVVGFFNLIDIYVVQNDKVNIEVAELVDTVVGANDHFLMSLRIKHDDVQSYVIDVLNEATSCFTNYKRSKILQEEKERKEKYELETNIALEIIKGCK